ncbi:MAG: hypothetical protein R2695_15170 [Acidimicrobiales bacterium]
MTCPSPGDLRRRPPSTPSPAFAATTGRVCADGRIRLLGGVPPAPTWYVAKHPGDLRPTRAESIEDLDPPSLEQMRDMLLAMDPPRHTAHRRPIAPEFKARVIGQAEARIRTITRSPTADATGRGSSFVHDVRPPPVAGDQQVTWDCLGDRADIHAMAERNSGGRTPTCRRRRSGQLAETWRCTASRSPPDVARCPSRRPTPLLGGEFDGKADDRSRLRTLLRPARDGGNDTTRNYLERAQAASASRTRWPPSAPTTR